MKIVEYKPRYGEVCYPEGFEETIRGLSIEEQIPRFRICNGGALLKEDWRTRARGGESDRLDESRWVSALIVRDGLIVGVLMNTYPWGDVSCLVEKVICAYDSDDNNGAGYKSVSDYKGVACLAADAE